MRAPWSVSAIFLVVAGSAFATPVEVPCDTDVAGRITGIQVGGARAGVVGEHQLRIMRRQISQPVQNGMPLCAGDQISVLGDTVLVMSLGEYETDITVHPVTSFELANSRSISLRIGKFFATLRGFFEAKTSLVMLAAKGTEFEVEVTDTGIEVLQLEGEVEITPLESEQAKSTPGEIHLVSMQSEHNLPTPLKLKRLQRIVVATPRPFSADEERVFKAIDVNANVILTVRPAQPSISLIPNFDSEKARAAAYRKARFYTIWSPGDASHFEVLGNVYVDWAESRKALVSYTKGGQSPPAGRDAAVYHHNLGTAYRLAGEPKRAQEYFARSRKEDPFLVFSYNDEGDLYADLAGAAADAGNVEQARNYLDRAAALYEKSLDPELHGLGDKRYQATPAYHLGEVALLHAQWTGTSDEIGASLEQAQRWFKQALGSDSQSLFALVGLGRVSEAAQDVKGARAQYEAALKYDSSFAPAHVAMGDSYAQQGDWNMATRYFRRATQADPHFPLAYYKTANAMQKSGNPELARNYYGSYVQIESPLMRDGARMREAKNAISRTPPPPPPSLVSVPDLIGALRKELESRLAAAGLGVGRVQREASETAAQDTVIRQWPPANQVVRRDSAVDLWLSSGPPAPPPPPPTRVSVPDLTGASSQEAESRLAAAGLRVGRVRYAASETAAKDTAIRQRPSPNQVVNRDSAVDLWLSSGPPPLAIVPDLTGSRPLQAVLILAAAELSMREVPIEGGGKAGTIVKQDPPAGSRVKRGTEITVYVSSGSSGADELVYVPNIVKKTTHGASAELERSGLRFELRVGKAPEHSAYVQRQDPPAGTRVRRGSTVVGFIE
jgi:beta-lactam-binding protein with PASTA domain/tetratricopeptide (TPR) repeat protein